MTALDFGKYAIFIWPALGITAAVLVWMVADSVLRARFWAKRASALEAEHAGRNPTPLS